MPTDYIPLPSDFVDRPRWKRWWINILVLLRIRTVKRECCESFRKGTFACKGCPTLYDKQSASWIYRTMARYSKERPSKP